MAAEDPAKAAIEDAAKKTVSDPIDIATGDMVLSQTDITLPGTLPLVLGATTCPRTGSAASSAAPGPPPSTSASNSTATVWRSSATTA